MDRIQVDDGWMEGIKSYCSQQSPNTKPVTMTSECSDKRILVQMRAGGREGPSKGDKWWPKAALCNWLVQHWQAGWQESRATLGSIFVWAIGTKLRTRIHTSADECGGMLDVFPPKKSFLFF